MFSLDLKKSAIIALVAAVSLCVTAVASASNKSFDFSIQPQVSFVAPGENVAVSFEVTNNTNSAATCYFHVEELNFDAPLGTIAASQSAAGGLSTPTVYKNGRLTFDLVCDGNTVDSRSVNVKVR